MAVEESEKIVQVTLNEFENPKNCGTTCTAGIVKNSHHSQFDTLRKHPIFKARSNEDESCNSRSHLTVNSHALSSTLINFKLVQKFDKS